MNLSYLHNVKHGDIEKFSCYNGERCIHLSANAQPI